MKKLVVFDLDGTLNRTDLYAVQAHKLALAEFGITDISDEKISSHFGARPEDYIKDYFPNATKEQEAAYHKKASQYENELIKEHGKPFDGIPSLLAQLKQEGYLLAVCSNSSARYINMVLDILHLKEYISFIQPLLPDMTKKETLGLLLEAVSADKAIMVGDRIYDMQAAEKNNLPFIGCAYGYNPEEMKSADFTAYHPSEILLGVKQLIG